jgi:hypothetical protein
MNVIFDLSVSRELPAQFSAELPEHQHQTNKNVPCLS